MYTNKFYKKVWLIQNHYHILSHMLLTNNLNKTTYNQYVHYILTTKATIMFP